MVRGSNLFLLIDKENILGTALGSLLQSAGTVVVVSKKEKKGDTSSIFVPFSYPVPKIPEGKYTHMLFVWDEESEHMLDPLLEKAAQCQSQVYVIFRKKTSDIDRIKEQSITTFILGDLFGGPEAEPLDEFLASAKATKQITLLGMGLHIWYPIAYEDAVGKIAEMMLSAPLKGKTFLVGSTHKITALSIAHLLQKVDPEIKVDFSGTKEEIHELSLPSIFDAYSPLEKIQTYFRSLRTRYKKEKDKPVITILSKKKNKKRRNGTGLYVLYLLLVFLFLPFIIMAFGSGLGTLFLTSGIKDAEKGSFVSATQNMDAATITFSFAKSAADIIAVPNNYFFKNSFYERIHKEIGIAYQATLVADDTIIAGEKLHDVLSGKTLLPKDAIENAVGNIKHASVLLSTFSVSDVPAGFQPLVRDIKALSDMGSAVVDELPQILGVGGDRKYLILFQNNMELRPGGGFIGSYGILSLHNGTVMSFTIHDVYDADGQLRGHIEPPFAIRRYIPLVHLYLRDSNFDPDFSRDAQITAYMLSQETGDKVDGVMGVDLDVLRGILASVGSVYVPSYNEMVTENNFFQLLESHSEKNFFPGSTQKKDFLSAVATALLLGVQRGISGKILLDKVVVLLSEKHIAFGFSDPSLQVPFSLAGLSGSLLDDRASQSAGLNDFLGVVEANLGINKVNAFISRKVTQQVAVKENGNVNETVYLTLTNNSDGTWPGGPYKDYVRFILPSNALLTGITVDNVTQHIVDAITDPKVYETKSFAVPQGLEVAKDEEQGKILYGFLLSVPVNASKEIAISYTIPHVFTFNNSRQNYNLFLWKQMGIDSYPYQLQVILPASLRLLQTSIPFAKNDQVFSYKTSIAGNMSINFSFTQK